VLDKLLEKRNIDSEELETLLELRKAQEVDFLLVDVRELSEYNDSHIDGVDLFMPSSQIFMWIDELYEQSTQKCVILTCRTGRRSGSIQRFLSHKGHQCVINHIGGIVSYNGQTIDQTA